MTTTTVPTGRRALSDEAAAALRDSTWSFLYNFVEEIDIEDPADLREAAEELLRAADMLDAADTRSLNPERMGKGHRDRVASLVGEYREMAEHAKEDAVEFSYGVANPRWTGTAGDSLACAQQSFLQAAQDSRLHRGICEIAQAVR